MARWSIQNYHKKNANERQFWIKDGITIIREESFRWGKWVVDSDERPDIDLDNPDGWEPGCDGLDWEMWEMNDGWWAEWEFPEDMDEEEQERIRALWDEDSYEGMEEDGWVLDETEYCLYGPLLLTNDDTEEEFHGRD